MSTDGSLAMHYGDDKKLMKPLIGYKELIEFSEEEMALAFHLKNASFLNVIQDANSVAQSLHFFRNDYERRFFFVSS